ncbi:MAG: hypothetical protein ACI97B_001578 [Verrucomicrobiales bacterium]|jgi:hypothetical protein
MLKPILFLCLLVLPPSFGEVPVPQHAVAILSTIQTRQGLCVLVGSKGDLCAHLDARSQLLVLGLSTNREDQVQCQQAINQAGVSGQARIILSPDGALPLVPHLANVIVVEDKRFIKRVGMEEVMHILAPGGELVA